MLTSLHSHLSRLLPDRAKAFAKEEDGLALVEFGIALPIMVLIFGVAIEGGRTMMAYQAAISGVRDATRYLARAVPSDICEPTVPVPAYLDDLTAIVSRAAQQNTVFPTGVSIGAVTVTYTCFAGTYRTDPAAVATVTAPVSMPYPFGGVFTLWGQPAPTMSTSVTDSARVFGS